MSAADLLLDLARRGIRLEAEGDRLRYYPRSALTPDLLGRLKAHKADVLAMLRPAPKAAPSDRADAAAVWQAALDRLEGDPLFPPDVLKALRAAKVRWADEAAPPMAPESTAGHLDGLGIDAAQRPAERIAERFPLPANPCDDPKPACTCGGTAWRDVPIHGGRSVRRDCGRCGRFLDFPVWHGKDAGHIGQHPIE